MGDKYILDDNNNPIPATLYEWGKWLEEGRGVDRRIVKQEEVNGRFISTVFIGLDCNLSLDEETEKHKPHIFETMVFSSFGDFNEIYCERYSTWKESEEGHKRAVKWINDGCNDNEEIDNNVSG